MVWNREIREAKNGPRPVLVRYFLMLTPQRMVEVDRRRYIQAVDAAKLPVQPGTEVYGFGAEDSWGFQKVREG